MASIVVMLGRANALAYSGSSYLYTPGELERGHSRHATDPVWSLTVHTTRNVIQQVQQAVLYYLNPPAP